MRRRKPRKPRPPADLAGEALAAWHRLVKRLEALDALRMTDPEMMRLWADQMGFYRDAQKKVAADGFEVEQPNGVTGRSTAYTVMKEMAASLRRLAKDMGITTRDGKNDVDDLDI